MKQRFELPNGPIVLLEKQPWLSTVAINFTFRIGSRHEPKGLEGASHFIEHLLFKGTSRRTVDDIAIEINRQGGFFNAVTSTDYMRLETRVIPTDFQDALSLMRDMVTDSIFPEKEFERERGVILEEIAEYNDSPEDKCFDEWLCSLWADQPLGRAILGTVESINAMERRSLVVWFRSMLHPSHCMISVAGNFTDEDERQVLDFFNNWKSAPDPIAADPKSSGFPSHQVINRDLEQVHFCMGMEGPSRNDPRRYAFQLGELILGGGMGSRLFTEIREKRGLAYTISSSWFGMGQEGYFLVFGSTVTESLQQVAELVRYEITRMAQDGPTVEELRIAREQFRRLILMSRDNPGTAANRNADRELYGDPHVTEDELLESFMKPEIEDIQKVCAEVFSRPMTECFVGDMEETGVEKVAG